MYFDSIQAEVDNAYAIATSARAKGKDPETTVEILLAEDLAARVEGLVSTFFPTLFGSGLKDGIRVLEGQYGKNDERVALLIGRDVAIGKYGDFGTKEKFAEVGLRVAVAYLTLGVVTAPLEGISKVLIKKNDDGTDYLAVYYAGPIRSAGGTASAVSVLAADFIRKALKIDAYKPTDMEVNRYFAEVEDYYTRVTAKQYHPTKEEMTSIIRNVPVEITGDPTEELEVSTCKDLPRVETNKIRGGMCLILLDGIPLKAEKVLGRVKKYPDEYDLKNWLWLADFVKLKNSIHAAKKVELKDNPNAAKYTPKDTYLSKVLAGRPIFAHPSKRGGFRLRYGRSRTGGLAATSLHPAAMWLTEFIAVGTQLATEFPGKATVCAPCDTIDPPVVKLRQGSILELRTREEVKQHKTSVASILSLGDIVVPYGEFVSNNHMIMPSAYCAEWWLLEMKKAVEGKTEKYLPANYASNPPPLDEAFAIARELGIPLHPEYNFFWHDLTIEELRELIMWFSTAAVENDAEGERVVLVKNDSFRILEILCTPCIVKDEKVTLSGKSLGAYYSLGKPTKENVAELLSSIAGEASTMLAVSKLAGIRVRERGLTRIGIRMGRPEKAEKRLLKGRPQILFPCGAEGGKMRNLMESYASGKVTAEFPVFKCASCGAENVFSMCPKCNVRGTPRNICQSCNSIVEAAMHCNQPTRKYRKMTVKLKELLDQAFNNISVVQLPKLFKGVKGVSGPERSMEYLEKGVLRTKYELYVNKDGTTRYDASDISMTHFKPSELGVSVAKLKSIGYVNDCAGKPLENENQVLELRVQDIVISDNEEFSSVNYMLNVSRFIDELLVKFYGLPPYYNMNSREDLVGQLVVGLAPHTSAGIVGRIVGFTRSKVCYAHPFWHAGKRRNCDGDEDSIMLLMDALLNFSRKFLPDTRGGRSVAANTIIYTVNNDRVESLPASKLIDDQISKFGARSEGGFDVCRANPQKIEAICFDPNTKKVMHTPISAFIRHHPDKKMYEIKTTNGRITVTEDHNIFITRGSSIITVKTSELKKGDCVMGLFNVNLDLRRISEKLDLFELLDPCQMHVAVTKNELAAIRKKWNLLPNELRAKINCKWNTYRYLTGQRMAPLAFYKELGEVPSCRINFGRGEAINRFIDTDTRFFALLGYLLSEGDVINGELVNTNPAIFKDMQDCLECVCGIKPKPMEDKRKAKICYRLHIPKPLLAALHKLGIEPKRAREKTIPAFVFSTSSENKKAFVSAYVRGDGHIYKEKNFTKIYTSSISMASQMSLLLHTMGFKTSCYATRTPKHEILFSELNGTDPWWPLWDITKELYSGLRTSGLNKLQVSRILANYRKNSRTKTASKDGIKKLIGLVADEKLRNALRQIYEGDIRAERVISVREVTYGAKYVYDLEVPKYQNFLCGPHPLFVHNTMDAPLVLTSKLNPEEVDDEAWKVDISDSYPLEFYEDSMLYKTVSELTKKPRIVADVIKTPEVFHIKFTHGTNDVNDAPIKTKYVELGSMKDKVTAQLGLAEKIVAVNKDSVAEAVISKHFLRDIKGNLRTFSEQKVRCANCNAKYRRVPLIGKCYCGGKLMLSVSEGAIRKYIEPTKHIIETYKISPYLFQQFTLLEKDVDSLFGKKARQLGLEKFNAK